jgi:glycosyltransferase involved in cell wall biosynthesis
MQGISIVTGTLNRLKYLGGLIENTVHSGGYDIELVLVDGGSTDGTVEYIKRVNHPRVKLVEVGKRSSYPHYMNLGVKAARHENICQWNDDVLLYNDWDDVFTTIDDEHDAYLFNWKEGDTDSMKYLNWSNCAGIRDNGWKLHNCADYDYPNPVKGEIVMNYGIYKKDVFRKHGLYNTAYQYYCADGEMAMRAYYSGVKFKSCTDVKVCVLPAEKRAIMLQEDVQKYHIDCHWYLTGPDLIKKRFDNNCGEYLNV